MPEPIGLKYSGTGWIAGVPARDLTPAEVIEYGGAELLTQNGVYVLPEPPKKAAANKKEGDQ